MKALLATLLLGGTTALVLTPSFRRLTPVRDRGILRGARTEEDIRKGPRDGNAIEQPSGEPIETIAAQWINSAANGLQLETQNTR